MTVWEWFTLYALVGMVMACLCAWREIARLRVENRAARVQRELLERVFKSVATDWAELRSGSIQRIVERMSDSQYEQLLESIRRGNADSPAEQG